MELAIYAHPWDLRALSAQGGLARLRDVGYGEVALAVSYHAGRWLTPWHPDGMVRFLEDGTVHYRPRSDHGPLRPVPSGEVQDGAPSPLEWLCEAAPRAGLRARAWAVLTHNSRLGALHPDCCVQNAFGDRYRYALCGSNEPVQRYIAAMVRDLAAHRGLHAIELEAIAPLGHRHNSHHDKSSFGTEVYADQLLSMCFCAGCRAQLAAMLQEGRALGAERVERMRAAVASVLRRRFADGDCMEASEPRLDQQQVSERLRADCGGGAEVLLGRRGPMARQTLAVAHGLSTASGVRLCAQTNYDALHQAAAVPMSALAGVCDEAALTVYGEPAKNVAAALPQLATARGADRPAALRLCLHPRAPQYASDDELRNVRDLCRAQGIGSISIYHLGLLPWRTIERAARVLGA